MSAAAKEIAAYKGAKGSLHFQFDQPPD